ncbi:MAG: hypothetical protein ACOYB1_15570 [Limnohabitans sp.]
MTHEKAAFERLFLWEQGMVKDSFWLQDHFAVAFDAFIQDNRLIF